MVFINSLGISWHLVILSTHASIIMCFPPLIVTNNSLESRAIGPILQTRKLRVKEVNLPAQDPATGISAPGTEILSPDSLQVPWLRLLQP